MLFLPPGQSAFYTWIDPQGDRTLIWGHDLSKASHDFENLLVTDGQGLVDLGSNKCLAWVSFLDGMQRVLLFTEDADRCWRLTQNIGEIERIAMVIFTLIFYNFFCFEYFPPFVFCIFRLFFSNFYFFFIVSIFSDFFFSSSFLFFSFFFLFFLCPVGHCLPP